MERIIYRITLDAHKGGIQRTLQGFETADNMSRQIAISLVSGSDTYELPKDHVTALMYISRDDTSEPNIQECSISGDTIIFDVPRMQEGITELQLKLVEGDLNGARSVLASPKFAVEVSESNTDDEGAEQSTEFTALEDAIAKAQGVYDERLLRVDIGKDCVFRAYYADGSVYENYYLYEALYNGNALLSESWAKGGTGIRDGEDTNNAKYFSNVSKSAAEDMDMVSTEARELLEEARLQTTFTSFHVDFETGNLGYLSANYTFNVNEETGNLEAENDGSYDPEQVIGSVVDEYIDQKSEELTEKVDTAVSIAKGKNQAHVFSTTEDMSAWLSNADNKGLYNVGDNLYIVATDVPDWWISEVLDEVDSETGYYYKIAQLETQKVDLTEINKSISENTKNINGIKSSILDTMEEIEANTQSDQLAGALSLKEMNATHKSDIAAVNKSIAEGFDEVGEALYTNKPPVVNLNTQDAIDYYLNVELPDSLDDLTQYTRMLNLVVAHSILGGGRYLLEGTKNNDDYQWQKLTSYSDDNSGELRIFEREKYAGVWKGWELSHSTTKIIDGDTVTNIGSLRINKFNSQVEYEAATLNENELYAFPDITFRRYNDIQQIPTTGTFAYSGVSVTIPAKTFFTLTARLIFANAAPETIGFSRSPDNYDECISGKLGYHTASCTLSDYAENEVTYYMWADFDGDSDVKSPIVVCGYFVTEG